MTLQPPNGTPGPPPPQGSPLISGLIDTSLSGGTITLGNVVIEDPATGNPFPSQNGGLPTYVVGPNPLPVTVAAAAETRYLAAAVGAALAAAGGNITLAAALATTRVMFASFSVLPTAALSGTPALRVELTASGGLVLAAGVVTGQAPLILPIGSGGGGALVGTAGALTIVYGANSGSLEMEYTVIGESP